MVSSSRIEETISPNSLDSALAGTSVRQAMGEAIGQFDHMLRTYACFNALFLTVGFTEFIILVFFFAFLMKSALLALSLAIVFLTFFSYFILRLYLQAKKPDQLEEIKRDFLQKCKVVLHYQEGILESHAALSNACAKLASSLRGRENDIYLPLAIGWTQFLTPYLKMWSRWCHWQDVHQFRELCLHNAIEENLKLVKCAPTTLEGHVALANSYIMLSNLYSLTGSDNEEEGELWTPNNKLKSANFEKKYRAAATRAIEEFKILNEFSPDDPWIHSQLAYSYRDLKMSQEEMEEYKIILKLNPGNFDALFKLGVLYFQQGFNAQGLRIYDQLKRLDIKQADVLIKYYGANSESY